MTCSSLCYKVILMMTTTPTTNPACIQNHTTLKRSASRMSNVAVVVPMKNPYRHCRKKQAAAAATMTVVTSSSMIVSQDEEPKDSTVGVVDYDKDEFGALWLPDDIVCQLLAQAEGAYDARIQRQQQQASVSVSSQSLVAKAGLQQPQPMTTKNHLRFSQACLTPETLSTRSSPPQPPLEI